MESMDIVCEKVHNYGWRQVGIIVFEKVDIYDWTQVRVTVCENIYGWRYVRIYSL